PFTANDLQLEIAMLDPYYRLNLQKVGPGEFSSGIFKLPDTYGVFTFRLIYQRPFLSYLKYENQVVLRPYALNEYERFITSAFPYYCNIFSNLFGFTLL
ncbi:Dolichyl-diphosphooligosaccharide-protein glycosyltransferase 48kDa subunit, partial [Rozella allomycis CSF55]